MVDVHFVKNFVSEEVALAVSDMEGVYFALNDQHYYACASTGE